MTQIGEIQRRTFGAESLRLWEAWHGVDAWEARYGETASSRAYREYMAERIQALTSPYRYTYGRNKRKGGNHRPA